MKLKRAFFASFSLLTTIPFFGKVRVCEEDLRESVIFFPLVGFFIGAISSILSACSLNFFSREIAVLFYLLATIFLTGGIHLDGLSDTFDALSIKTLGKKEEDILRRLDVMASGTQGPFGSLALVFDLLFKFFFLLETISFYNWWLFFVLTPVLSKACLVIFIFFGKRAKDQGMGKILLGQIKDFVLVLSFLVFLSTSLIFTRDFNILAFIVIAFFFICTCGVFIEALFERKFGGQTGDTLGALNEFSEVLFLALVNLVFK